MPQWIKVDNGRPFGDPQGFLLPPLALWLIGLGIRVIWNRPATPQDNAVVERNQGVMAKWTEYGKCQNSWELQLRLWREVDFYNYHFPIRRKESKKRIELFPTLYHTTKQWNSKLFKLKRVLVFIAKASWERKVSDSGQVSIYGKRYYLDRKHNNQIINLKLNPRKNCWNVFNDKAKLNKELPSPNSTKSIWNLQY
ncbi:MAG: hypothetical protein AAF696_26480 [Bacteroidota bacterium]